MRKVTEKVCKAFLAGEKCACGNTSTNGEVLLLHGNTIARRINHNTIEIYDGGWKTATTKERLNGLLKLFFPSGIAKEFCVNQKKWQWYFHEMPWYGGGAGFRIEKIGNTGFSAEYIKNERETI